MKRLILPICLAAVAVAAAVLLIVYRTPPATGTSADVAREAGAVTGDLAGNAESERDEPIEAQGEGPVGEGDVATERDAPPPEAAESQEKAPSKPDENAAERIMPDGTRDWRPDMGGPGMRASEGPPDWPARRAERMLERMDTDGDGKISRDEWRKPYDEAFAQADKNSDGYIDSTEMSGFRPPGGMGPGGRRRDQGPGPGGPPGGNE